ncbi:hypothetical protein [Streptomyces macrosporus]|uniref:Uncharacterized protein n=1 Tax=Streptomyces macrosporus TaxID=44032 RepID=A0ABN3KG03_9ACTN
MEVDRLRFRAAPRTEVRFDGTPGRRATTTDDRVNLPAPVATGVDYHDVRIAYALANRVQGPASREEW